MPEVGVTIRVDEKDAAELSAVVKKLEALGLREVESRARFGIVHGRVERARLNDLKEVEGVASVREEKIFKALG